MAAAAAAAADMVEKMWLQGVRRGDGDCIVDRGLQTNQSRQVRVVVSRCDTLVKYDATCMQELRRIFVVADCGVSLRLKAL